MRTIGDRGGVLQIIVTWPEQFDPRDSMRNPPGGGRVLGNAPNALPATGPPRGRHTRAAGQLHTHLMAGRRRRTPAAALRWRRCRCRCRSSSRSTCAGIECHSSPPRSTRRRPRARLCSMAWNFRKGPRTDFQEIIFEFHTVVRYKSRPPVGASGSNSIFGAV